MGFAGDHEDSRTSDDAAFRDYVLARGTALLRIAVMLTGNRADAEDLVQAALASTYLAWDKINDRAALDAYVRRVMVNTHISWWRRRKLEEFPTDELPDQAVADHARESDLAEVVRRALDRLPRRMRAAVMLRYFEDMTEPEIAALLGVSLGTVKSTVSRAVARLRIDAELGEDSGALSWHCRPAVRRLVRFSTIGKGFQSPRTKKSSRSWNSAARRAPTARRLTRGTIRYAGQHPQEVAGAQHDHGHPADGRVDHALRNVDIR
jgi:RNA polymerase sigma-70 factor (sigma-E family)